MKVLEQTNIYTFFRCLLERKKLVLQQLGRTGSHERLSILLWLTGKFNLKKLSDIFNFTGLT